MILVATLATLIAIEIILRVIDLRILRQSTSERSLAYRYDAELGWVPVPSSSSIITTARTIHAQHNSLGFRDVEFVRDARPTLLLYQYRECRRFGVRHGSGISLAAADLIDDPAATGRAGILLR
jgi:hypothetical protein